jgi:hypothetical protein
MYQVFDSGKPADCHHQSVNATWANSKFDTWAEALTYATNWLGIFQGALSGIVPNVAAYYSYGCTIEIRKL